MARKYYFDNQKGHVLYSQQLQQAGVRTTRRQFQSEPISTFLRYKHILDPDATITYDASDTEAIRLIEVIKPDAPQTQCLINAINDIDITKNTVVVNFFEPLHTLPMLTSLGIKCISLPWGQKDSSLSRSIPLMYPLLTFRDDDTGNFTKVDYFKNLNKPYKFLTLCNKVMPWKLMLHAGLHDEDLVDQGLISLRWRGSISNDWHDYFSNSTGLKYTDTAKALLQDKKILDLGEDIDSLTARKRYSHKSSWYESTWLSLVIESTTDSTSDYPYITEKTMAPLIAGHPFVVYGENNSIQLLKTIGFDVYDWLFTHTQLTDQQRSLSRIEQDVIRVENVIQDVKHFSKEMVLDNQKLVKEAMEHNQNLIDSGCLTLVSNEWQRVIGELTN